MLLVGCVNRLQTRGFTPQTTSDLADIGKVNRTHLELRLDSIARSCAPWRNATGVNLTKIQVSGTPEPAVDLAPTHCIKHDGLLHKDLLHLNTQGTLSLAAAGTGASHSSSRKSTTYSPALRVKHRNKCTPESLAFCSWRVSISHSCSHSSRTPTQDIRKPA